MVPLCAICYGIEPQVRQEKVLYLTRKFCQKEFLSNLWVGLHMQSILEAALQAHLQAHGVEVGSHILP